MILRNPWNVKTYVTNYDENIFNSAIGNPLGVIYEPIAVAEKNVNGATRFRFIAKVTPLTFPPESNFAVVEITEPRNGSPYITNIYEIRDQDTLL